MAGSNITNQSIIKNMKKIALGVIALAIVALSVGELYVVPWLEEKGTVTHQATSTLAVAFAEEIVETDVLDEAAAELQRINEELDAEEAEVVAEIQVREERLERIRELRLSFQ